MPLYPAFNKITVAIVCILCLAMTGLSKLTSSASYLSYFDNDNPLVSLHLSKRDAFSSHDSLVLVLHSKNDNALSQSVNFYKNSSALVKSITALEPVQHVTNFLREYRLRNNVFGATRDMQVGLLSKDLRSALIILDVKLADNKSASQILAFNQHLSQLVQSHYQDPNIGFYLSGELGLNNAYITTVRHDLKRFLPLLFLSMLIMLSLIFLNLKIALAMFSIGLIATLSALGIIGWLGFTLTSINAFTPIMIIGLSIVTNMHNCLAFYQRIGLGQNKMQALQSSFQENLIPVSISCLTTAAGFLFLINSPSPPVVVTGIACALGIAFSWLLSISLYQSLLFKYAPSQTRSIATKVHRWQWPSTAWLSTFHRPILAIALSLFVLGSIGLSQLSINDNVYRYFPKNYPFSQSIDLLNRHFNGLVNIDYVIQAKPLPSQHKPIALNLWSDQHFEQLTRFAGFVESIAAVNQVYPPLKLLTSENLSRFYTTLDTSKSVFHTYLYKQGHQLRFQVRLDEMSSKELLAIDAQINGWVNKSNLSLLQISTGTSADILFAHLGYNNARSMFTSLLIALSLISLFTAVLLRSWQLCSLVFICNFLPITIAYGLLGLSGGYLTLGSTVVIGMIIGIIVDDTLHLLFKFRRFASDRSHSLIYFQKAPLKLTHEQFEQALKRLQQRVFAPVVLSSMVIILALAVGLISDFTPTYEISVFSILVITLALLTDLLLLPVLLKKLLVKPTKGSHH